MAMVLGVLPYRLFTVAHTVKLAQVSADIVNFAAVKLPKGLYLVLIDNRDSSTGSRVIGFLPLHGIVGWAGKVLFSLNYENYYLPRRERFLAKS